MRGHNTGHVGPDFYPSGVDAHGEQGRRVVGAAATQGGGPAVLVLGDEPRHYEQFGPAVLLHGFLHPAISFSRIHNAIPYADKCAGVQPSAGNALRKEGVGEDAGGKQFAETFHGGQAGSG